MYIKPLERKFEALWDHEKKSKPSKTDTTTEFPMLEKHHIQAFVY